MAYMNESFALGRIAGVRVGLNWSVLVVFSLIAWVLARVQLPMDFPGYPAGAYWLAGIVTAMLFFACLLAHEMAHAVIARRDGVDVEGITLWLFGGVAKLRGDSMNARSELRIALAGPVASLCIAGALVGLSALAHAAGVPLLVAGSGFSLGAINLLLALFNLVPAFPLDGGRVLRALLWRRSSRARATTIAAWGGRIFGMVMMAAGLISLWQREDFIQGAWILFLGWFLFNAARMEESHVLLREGLHGMSVTEVMSAPGVVAAFDLTLEELAELAETFGVGHVPVRSGEGAIAGLVEVAQTLTIPRGQRATVRAGDIARPLEAVVTVGPHDTLAQLLDRLAGRGGYALVLSDGALLGVVTEADLHRAVRRAASV